MKALFALVSGLLGIAGNSALASTFSIPLDAETPIAVGQGYDLTTGTWKKLCLSGTVQGASLGESTLDYKTDSSASEILALLQGQISGGVSLFGLAKAKVSGEFSKSSGRTDKSTSEFYRWSIKSWVEVMNRFVPTLEASSLLAHGLTENFRKECGTHAAMEIGRGADFSFSSKFSSFDSEWLEKIRLKVKAKGPFGVGKKTWTKEEKSEGRDAKARHTVTVYMKGANAAALRAKIGLERTFTCDIENIESCQSVLNKIQEFVNSDGLSELPGIIDSQDQYPQNVALLVPYEELSSDFNALEVHDVNFKRLFYLQDKYELILSREAVIRELRQLDVDRDQIRELLLLNEQDEEMMKQCTLKSICEKNI